jgi:hypothetical protein
MTTQFIVRSEGEKQLLAFSTMCYDGINLTTVTEGGITIFEISDPDAVIELVVRRKSPIAAAVAPACPYDESDVSKPPARATARPKSIPPIDQTKWGGGLLESNQEVSRLLSNIVTIYVVIASDSNQTNAFFFVQSIPRQGQSVIISQRLPRQTKMTKNLHLNTNRNGISITTNSLYTNVQLGEVTSRVRKMTN